MRKTFIQLIIIVIFCSLLLVGSIFFINKNFSYKNVKRDFLIVKFENTDYPFEIAIQKNTTIKNALSILHIYEIESIYEIQSRNKIKHNLNDKINHDTNFEVKFF